MSRSASSAFPQPRLITTTDALAEVCARLRREPFVTVDTEFMREKTYWPELCVVQLGGTQDVVIIDALADGLDLAPLGELLADIDTMKVFHAARQDIEIFVLRFGATPRPVFDTQIAAMVAGFGDQVGYDSLVAGLTGATIDKVHRFSDWSARPLSPAQVTYAAADVTHLRDVYLRLHARLEAEGRLAWVTEEMSALLNPNLYRVDPETAWERLRPRSNNRRFLALVQALASWREREAQRVNIPRQRLIKDETLLEIAATAPTSADDLTRARGVTRGFAEGRSGVALMEVVARVRAMPDDALPETQRKVDSVRPSAALVSLLKVLLAAKCEDNHVAPKLVASSDDIDRLAAEADPDIPALHGWRRTVFGDAALALKAGQISLGVAGRRIRLIPVDP